MQNSDVTSFSADGRVTISSFDQQGAVKSGRTGKGQMEKVYAAKHVTLLIYINELPYSFNASDGSSDKWQMVQNAVVQEYCITLGLTPQQ